MFKKNREEFIYVDLMNSIKEEFGQGDMKLEDYDKDDNKVIDVAETLLGLSVSIEELNSLIGVHTNIQKQIDELKNRKPKMMKTIHTIKAEKNQSEFMFDRNIEDGIIVELRSNSTWIHDEDYIISENKIILKNPFPIEKQIDFIFYESTF